MESTDARLERAREIVGWYTLVASGTGAVPLPASSAAIIANNGFMLAHVGAVMGSEISWATVGSSLGIAGTLNVAGRTIFIEGAKSLSWGTGSVWALVGLSALGATTAALQTYAVGLIAIEICKNGGAPIDTAAAAHVYDSAKQSLQDFVAEMRNKKLSDPDAPSLVEQQPPAKPSGPPPTAAKAKRD